MNSFSDLHFAATVTANASEDDVVVVVGISFSGQTIEVAKLLALANQKGATTISLTKYGSSIVSDRADIRLYTSTTKEATFLSGATSSRMAQPHVINILFMRARSQEYEETVTHLDKTREAVDFIKGKHKSKIK